MTDDFGKGGKGGERRYGKPASGGSNTERKYGKPAPSGGNTERKFGKPAPSGSNNERKYGKPAPGNSSERKFGKPAPSGGNTERKYGKPAPGNSSERKYGKPAPSGGNAERKFAKPAPRFAKPAPGNNPDRKFGKPAPRFAKPAPSANQNSSRTAPVEETGFRLGARRLAYDILCDVHQNGAFAGLSLTEHLRGKAISPEDRRLLTNIVYGTLENELRIDFALDRLMDRPTNEPSQRDILRMSAYQILFLDRVPDSAAVNEAVKLCKVVGMEGASGFINAVLRNLVRGKDDIPYPKREDDPRAYLHIMTSTPLWLVDRLIAAYGLDEAERILAYRETGHPVVVRPNLHTSSDEQLEKLLTDKGLRFERGVAPHAFLVYGGVELHLDPDYQKGLFSMQGQSSMLAAEAIDAKPGMRILDACAAPGGKSAYLCERMQLTGRVFAWELHEKRTLLLEATKRRLRLENLRITTRDATEPRPDLEGTLDAVLLDAPCSGTGVIAQKPDIKLRVTSDDVEQIVDTQARLLRALCCYVKPGGTLVYSTCSILPEENEQQLSRFLDEHTEFAVEALPLSFPEALRKQQTPRGLQLLGYRDGAEGFFIARMRRAR